MNFVALLVYPLLAQAAESSPAPAASPQATLLKLMQAGGWVMIPLLVASIITLTLVLVCMFSLRRGTVVSRRFMETADALLRKRDYLGLIAISNRHSEAVARITSKTLDFATKNPSAPLSAVREVAEAEGARLASNLNRRVTYLADIATLAPMLGLLGTVVGIINSFGVLANNTSQPRQMLLAGGVAQALVTTAAGLIIGIVAMVFYSLYRGRVASMISDLEAASSHILNTLVIQQQRRQERSRVLEGGEV
ncbi:MAG: MotA/TolQ/ExbB proton channel family protein [Verrucomicrobia bacterium]|nr:MotA/TolQ/ExbB proton channel family protein [Verrucomicrobiota bacterium]